MSTDERESQLKKMAVALCQNPRMNAADLAKTAGISKATFYRAYESRDNLWELMNQKAAGAVEAMSTIFSEDCHAPEEYQRVLHDAIELACANKAYLMLLCYGIVTGNCEARSYDKYRREVILFFRKGQRDGAFRIDLPADAMTEIFRGTMGALFDGACEGNIATAHIAEYWEKFFLSGIKA